MTYIYFFYFFHKRTNFYKILNVAHSTLNMFTKNKCELNTYNMLLNQRRIWGGGGGGGGGTGPPFLQSLIFGNQFEELQTVLIEIKLIINNATLTYVYPNTIITYLTFNRLAISCSNITSTVIRNLTLLNRIGNYF